MTHAPPDGLLRPGDTCWRVEDATKVAVIIDADKYFRVARAAMCKAQRRIMMIGWDFDARIELDRSGDAMDGPTSIGRFIEWLVDRNEDLEVYLLRWDVGALKTLFHGRTILTLARWMRHPRIHIKLDGHHPTGASHHQKVVVIDDDLAFCGGIDMTDYRWDTRDHRDDDERRLDASGRHYPPWHDATTALQGPVASALGELCAERWHRAGGGPLLPTSSRADCWPDGLVPQFCDVPVAISRTHPAMPDYKEVAEIERLFVELIRSARTTIYAESQYFASRVIALAIAERLEDAGGPEIVIINPLTAKGWIEPMVMDTARGRFVEALRRRDCNDRFRIYHPFTKNGVPIYVHAKIMVVDNRILRIGSSNMNNRSLRLDTECDMTIDISLSGDTEAGSVVTQIRDSLLAEHLGVPESDVVATMRETGSLIATIEALRAPDRKTLRPFELPDSSKLEGWIADNEILDPEGPKAMFEPLSKRGLFRKWRPPRT